VIRAPGPPSFASGFLRRVHDRGAAKPVRWPSGRRPPRIRSRAGEAAAAVNPIELPYSKFKAYLRKPPPRHPLVPLLERPQVAECPSGKDDGTAIQTRTCLWRESNESLSAPGTPAGKTFAEARDRGGIFGDTSRLRATETELSRVCGCKAAES
jgi:hypothetical protein